MLKGFLIFLVGFLSMVIAVAGAVCAIQAIATGDVFCTVCAILFLPIWCWQVYDYMKEKCPVKLGDILYNKLFKK